MDTREFVGPRPFQVDPDWYEAYWLLPATPRATRRLVKRARALMLTTLFTAVVLVAASVISAFR